VRIKNISTQSLGQNREQFEKESKIFFIYTAIHYPSTVLNKVKEIRKNRKIINLFFWSSHEWFRTFYL